MWNLTVKRFKWGKIVCSYPNELFWLIWFQVSCKAEPIVKIVWIVTFYDKDGNPIQSIENIHKPYRPVHKSEVYSNTGIPYSGATPYSASLLVKAYTKNSGAQWVVRSIYKKRKWIWWIMWENIERLVGKALGKIRKSKHVFSDYPLKVGPKDSI